MNRDDRERIASLETRMDGMSEDLTEIKTDVKTLLAHHHAQKGKASMLAMIWAGLGGLVASIGGWLLSKF